MKNRLPNVSALKLLQSEKRHAKKLARENARRHSSVLIPRERYYPKYQTEL